MRRLAGAVLLCVGTLISVTYAQAPAPAGTEQQDTLYFTDASAQPKKVVVTKADYRAVLFNVVVGGTAVGSRYERYRIARIEYYDAPRSLTTAIKQFEEGDCANIPDLLAQAEKETKARPWLKEYIAYYRAECVSKVGKADDAVKAYDELLKTFPDTFFLFTAMMHKADCLVNAKKADAGVEVLRDAIRKTSVPETKPWAPNLRLALGKALVMATKTDEGIKEFDAAEQAAREAKDTETRGAALFAKADALVKANPSTAKSFIATCLGDATLPEAAKPGFKVLLGICRFKDAEKQTDKAQRAQEIRQTMWDLLEVVVLHPKIECEPDALFWLVKVFVELDDRDKAKQEAETLISKYPGTPQAAEAKTILGRLGR